MNELRGNIKKLGEKIETERTNLLKHIEEGSKIYSIDHFRTYKNEIEEEYKQYADKIEEEKENIIDTYIKDTFGDKKYTLGNDELIKLNTLFLILDSLGSINNSELESIIGDLKENFIFMEMLERKILNTDILKDTPIENKFNIFQPLIDNRSNLQNRDSINELKYKLKFSENINISNYSYEYLTFVDFEK